jgi:putative oxidoreductase
MTISLDLNPRSGLRWLLALLFIWAAASKLANVQEFCASLFAYQLPLPAGLLRLTAMVLPWLELLCGLMLLGRFWFRATLGWTVLLCAVFALCTGQAWARGLQISCGCLNLDFLGLGGGANAAAVSFFESVKFAFPRALLLLAAGAYLLWYEGRRSSPLRASP